MKDVPNGRRAPELDVQWRKSTYSATGNCVTMAMLDDGRAAVRNSKHPDAGVLFFEPGAMAEWIEGIKAGELDDLC